MKPDPFEEKLRNQPLRRVPPEWRQEILRAASNADKPRMPSTNVAAGSWSELLSTLRSRLAAILWPCPRAWAGLAAVWVGMLLFNHEIAPKGTSLARETPSAAANVVGWREQERLLTELMGPQNAPVADRPRPSSARPRSEWRRQLLMT